MRILLDTHAFLWASTEAHRLSDAAQEAFTEATELYLSSISVWEITSKFHSGKLPLPYEPHVLIAKQRKFNFILPLGFEEADAFQLVKLPPIHRDPFDRMLIAQAIAHNLTILTSDKAITQYPVATLW